jgi:hypothetical protein
MRQSWKRAVMGVALVGCTALASCGETTGACVVETDGPDGATGSICTSGVEASQCTGTFYEGKGCQDLL